MFRNPDNGYSVVSVVTREGEVTLTGILPELAEGEQIQAEGDWTNHPQYGRQFKAASVTIQAPETLRAIEKYLASGLIKGVGPSTARLIVEAFGKATLEVLSMNPDRLREVPKIGRKRMEQIAESFQAQQESRGTYLFLQKYGITPSLSAKIYKQYRNRAEEFIRQNPYRLIDEVDGVGFLTADHIAASIGIPEHSENRVKACVKHVLAEAAASSGHTCLPREKAIYEAAELLSAEEALVRRHLEELALLKEIYVDVIGGTEMASLPRMRQAEMTVATRLLRLLASVRQETPPNITEKIRSFEHRHGVRFSPTQRQAIVMAVTSGVSVVTGGPGTGKTTLINCVLSVLGSGVEAVLAAPTGRAAKRLQEACGRNASTIHRLLQYGMDEGAFLYNRENPLEAERVIVDEVSMMDVFLMKSLLDALPQGCRLLLVGDADQLPSVGPGNVLADILQNPNIPSSRLSEIFRQAEGSMIVHNAHRVNKGEFPELNSKNGDFFFETKPQADEAAQAIVGLCAKRLPAFMGEKDGMRCIQVLTPTRKGACGVIALNALLQAALNPPSPKKSEVQFGETVFRRGDKVMHVKNNYTLKWESLNGSEGQGVFNGDIGFITHIDPGGRAVRVLYDDEREVNYEYAQLEEVELAYCLSVHKSQGSEFPAVVMPMVGGPKMLLTRNLLYTGITRARKLVVLVGRQEVLRMMAENNRERRRYSTLSHWLMRMSEGM